MQKIIQEIKFFLNYLREDPYEFIAIVLGVFWLLLLLVGKYYQKQREGMQYSLFQITYHDLYQ